MRPRLRLIKGSSTSLLVRARADPDAFGAFYDAYSDRVLGFLARRVLDPEVALDLLSETFAKALERRGQFRGNSAEEEQAWLFSIARTELSHYWRSGQVERAAMERFAVTVPALSDAEHDRIEALAGLSGVSDALLDALGALPDDQRRAVELRVIEDRSYADVAAVLGVSEPTARARLARTARARARAPTSNSRRHGGRHRVRARDPSRAAQDAVREQLVAAARREPDPSRAAQNAVRDQLVAAARRELGSAPAPARRRRRRRWRFTGLIAVVLLGAAAAAESTGLISVGDPLPDPLPDTRSDDPRFAPATPGVAELVATAPDPERKLAWGVGIYAAADGGDCVIAGQVRGVSLGLERDGRFRPYDAATVGPCDDLSRRPIVWDRLVIAGVQPRTIVFGRTATPARPVVVHARGTRYTAQPGRGGGFLFVFSGLVSPADLRAELGPARP